MRKEYTRPVSKPIDGDANVLSILTSRVSRTADKSLIEYKTDNQWKSFTASEFYELVKGLAKGLIRKGVQPGEAIGILSQTRWEWTALDIAIMSIGALTVPIYQTNSASQVQNIANDSHIRMIFAENDEQRDKVESVIDDVPTLGEVLVIDKTHAQYSVIDTLLELGKTITDATYQARVDSIHGDAVATIVYTSGSTGTPKGIELTHRNFVYMANSGIQSMMDICYRPGGARLLLFLPLAHVFARYMQFYSIGSDIVLGLSSDMKTIIADFQSFKPTFILAVPRIFEKVFNAASQKAGSGIAGKLFASAAQTARQWSMAQQAHQKLSMWNRVKYAFFKKVVYSNIMDVFGGQVDYAVSGGAPLDSSIAHFFNGVGLPLLEGYGMTETCAPACVNPTSGYKIGSVGLPLEGLTFGVADDGELCIKGAAVCKGYHNHPELTQQQIHDGWLHTGDLGDIDKDGFIYLTGRKKELIITAGGKNVSPGILESSVMISPVVDQCVVIGDKRPFIAALVTLDLNDTNAWLKAQGAAPVTDLEEAAKNPIVIAEVDSAINRANQQVSRAESIRKFEIIPESFTEANGMLTASLKAKRNVIVKHYAQLIDTKIYVLRSGK
ncbi:AMP-dependent synthetase/ligase [Alloscardovia venturai]|uniref:Acyl-CoA synthetase n=1 Tax=Alloscardovia venturai TaxID=1769421 RepID=A0ABW2Y1Z6_9BIFI